MNVPKWAAMITAVMLNTLLISAPAMFVNAGLPLGDLRFWLLLILGNGFLIVEGALHHTERRQRATLHPSLDNSARHLALVSSMVLLAIYWCSIVTNSPPVLSLTCAGPLIFIAGILLRTVAMRQLGAYFRSDVSVPGHQQLVHDGIYRRLRHPSETGLLLIGLGVVVMYGSLPALALWLGIFMPLTLKRISLEEHCLLAAFGEEYREYARRTGGLLPRL